jgi:hypothetical protein
MRDFDLGDILSVTTGRLVSLDGIGGVYKILDYMTGESLFTHQLPRVSDEAKPVILKLHPKLAEIDSEADITPANCRQWLADQKKIYGDRLPVPKLNADQHERIDPLSELAEKIHPDKIIVMKV